MEGEAQRKYVTLEDVEKAIPQIERLVQDLQALQNAIGLLESMEITVDDDVDEQQERRYDTRINKAFHRLCYEFYQKLDFLERMGGIMKDLDQGLVDFPYRFEERDVFLCWRLGETSLAYWHEIEDGFTGRKKIIDLDKQ